MSSKSKTASTRALSANGTHAPAAGSIRVKPLPEMGGVPTPENVGLFETRDAIRAYHAALRHLDAVRLVTEDGDDVARHWLGGAFLQAGDAEARLIRCVLAWTLDEVPRSGAADKFWRPRAIACDGLLYLVSAREDVVGLGYEDGDELKDGDLGVTVLDLATVVDLADVAHRVALDGEGGAR